MARTWCQKTQATLQMNYFMVKIIFLIRRFLVQNAIIKSKN